MAFDVAVIGTWVAFILSLISLLGVIKAHFTGGTQENAEAIGKLGEKHAKLDMRVQMVENELQHLPSKDDFNALKVSFVEMKGDVRVITKSVEATERATQRMEKYLRDDRVKDEL